MSPAASLTVQPTSAGVGAAFASASRATTRYRSGNASALSFEGVRVLRASGLCSQLSSAARRRSSSS